MNDQDTIEYVPVEEIAEGPDTVTFTVTIKAGGGARVDVAQRGEGARRGQSQNR